MVLADVFPDSEALVSAPLHVVAGVILKILAPRQASQVNEIYLDDFIDRAAKPFGGSRNSFVIAEAWNWLDRNGLVCPFPGKAATTKAWMVTRAGKAAAAASDFGRWTEDRLLPAELLHPALRGTALQLFHMDKFDTAVFEAFKTLEVEIRGAAGLGPDWIGVKAAREAFHPEKGQLRDPNDEGGERQGLADLMAGAIGAYKNPHSHRRVELDAAEARELLMLASHLLRIVDSRRTRL